MLQIFTINFHNFAQKGAKTPGARILLQGRGLVPPPEINPTLQYCHTYMFILEN